MAFTNPLIRIDQPDPFLTYDKESGYYYYLYTRRNDVTIHRSRHAVEVAADTDTVTVYRAGEDQPVKGYLFAPEMHKAPNGKWYIYTSGAIQMPLNQSPDYLIVLESDTADPFDGFHYIGFLNEGVHAIDPSVIYDINGKGYCCYSRLINEDGKWMQVLEIADLVNPYTFGERRCIIGRATYDWELAHPGCYINEGGFFVKHDGRLFLFYSANGCWDDHYTLGVMELVGDDPCDAHSWKKHDKPFLQGGEGVYGTGHASFFTSPDGTETWVCYHTLKESDPERVNMERYPNLLKVSFDETGFPISMLTPPIDTVHPFPSGEEE